jgi:hypothetical protein
MHGDTQAARSQILALLDRMPNGFADLPGEVFSSGWSALTKGKFYLAGLNPMAGIRYRTVREHVANWTLNSFSAFHEQCWKKECWNQDCYGLQSTLRCSHQRGADRHQQAVQVMMKRAAPGIELARLFATNAIFARSARAGSFSRENQMSLARGFEACWPLHEFFLSIVRPRVILCLGYQDDGSPFSLFKRKAERGSVGCIDAFTPAGRRYASFKSARMTFDVFHQKLHCLVVGIRHPSYVKDAADTPEFGDLIREFLESNDGCRSFSS